MLEARGALRRILVDGSQDNRDNTACSKEARQMQELTNSGERRSKSTGMLMTIYNSQMPLSKGTKIVEDKMLHQRKNFLSSQI